MKKRLFAALLAALMLLGGCGMKEDPYRVDTVVRIPVDPTEAPTQAPTETVQTELPTETEEETEEATEEPTEKPTEVPKSTGTKKSTSSKKNSTGKKDTNKATEPKETEPEVTKPKATEPEPEKEETVPAETEAEETEPPAEKTEETESNETQPPETEPEKALYDISGYSVSSLGKRIRSEINALRKAEDVEKLSLDSYLSAIASCRAWELSQVWSHTRPDGRGYYTVLGDYGYGAGAVTELLVYGSSDASAIVAQWAASDSHLEKLLSEDYSVIGIGEYSAGGVIYICVLLAG